MILSICSCVHLLSIYPLYKVSVQMFCSSCYYFLFVENSLHILDTSSLIHYLQVLSPSLWFVVFLFNFFFSVYLFLGERQSVIGGGAEREVDTESEAGSRF